jgi:hypothetical protein
MLEGKRTLLKHTRIKQNGSRAQRTFPSGHNPINWTGRASGGAVQSSFCPTTGGLSRKAQKLESSNRSRSMSELPTPTRSRVPMAAVAVIAAVVVVAGLSLYYLSLGSNAQGQQYTCSFQPGGGFYLQVLSDTNGSPLAGISVSGELVSACPVVGSCAGQPGAAGSSCPPPRETATSLGKWSFATNGTGYVYVPGSDLAGNAFWFNLTYDGKSYLAKSQICNGGVTDMQLSLPSGATSGHEVPGNSGGVTAGQQPNGVQTVEGCNPVTFQGNAVIS